MRKVSLGVCQRNCGQSMLVVCQTSVASQCSWWNCNLRIWFFKWIHAPTWGPTDFNEAVCESLSTVGLGTWFKGLQWDYCSLGFCSVIPPYVMLNTGCVFERYLLIRVPTMYVLFCSVYRWKLTAQKCSSLCLSQLKAIVIIQKLFLHFSSVLFKSFGN